MYALHKQDVGCQPAQQLLQETQHTAVPASACINLYTLIHTCYQESVGWMKQCVRNQGFFVKFRLMQNVPVHA